MGVLGVGMGLIVSQLGNVVQSSVGERRPQRGGRPAEHRPAARLLARHRAARRDRDQRPDRRLLRQRRRQPEDRRRASSSRSRSGSAPAAASSPRTRSKRRRRRRGSSPATTAELVADYEDAQLKALKIAFLFAAALVLAAFFATRNLPPEPSCRRGRAAAGRDLTVGAGRSAARRLFDLEVGALATGPRRAPRAPPGSRRRGCWRRSRGGGGLDPRRRRSPARARRSGRRRQLRAG